MLWAAGWGDAGHIAVGVVAVIHHTTIGQGLLGEAVSQIVLIAGRAPQGIGATCQLPLGVVGEGCSARRGAGTLGNVGQSPTGIIEVAHRFQRGVLLLYHATQGIGLDYTAAVEGRGRSVLFEGGIVNCFGTVAVDRDGGGLADQAQRIGGVGEGGRARGAAGQGQAAGGLDSQTLRDRRLQAKARVGAFGSGGNRTVSGGVHRGAVGLDQANGLGAIRVEVGAALITDGEIFNSINRGAIFGGGHASFVARVGRNSQIGAVQCPETVRSVLIASEAGIG